MADIADEGNDTADLFLRLSLLKQQQSGTKVAPSGIGACLYCGTELADDRRWCDAECRDLWQSNQKRQGK